MQSSNFLHISGFLTAVHPKREGAQSVFIEVRFGNEKHNGTPFENTALIRVPSDHLNPLTYLQIGDPVEIFGRIQGYRSKEGRLQNEIVAAIFRPVRYSPFLKDGE